MEWTFDTSNLRTSPNRVSSTPTVHNGTVYFGGRFYQQTSDRPKGNDTLYAVNATTGEKAWRFTEPKLSIQSSPTVADETVYIGSNDETLYAVDAATGDEVWTLTEPTGDIVSTPTVADGTVYVGSRGTLAGDEDERDHHDDSAVHAVDAATGNSKWSFTAPSNWIESSPTVVNDREAGDSVGSRIKLGTLGHHHTWADEQAEAIAPPEDNPATLAITNIEAPDTTTNDPVPIEITAEAASDVVAEAVTVTLSITSPGMEEPIDEQTTDIGEIEDTTTATFGEDDDTTDIGPFETGGEYEAMIEISATNAETVRTSASFRVSEPPEEPTAEDFITRDEAGNVEDVEVFDAIDDFRSDRLESGELFDVISAFREA